MEKQPTQDKIRLLMEETGCDPGEAELALASTGYDLEKAVRAIAGLLRHIVALKAKFQTSGGLYGLVVAVADTRRVQLLRVRAVVSYNPALYETALEGDWYDVERALYAFRLGEGALQHVTQALERLLGDRWGSEGDDRFHVWLREGKTERILENAEGLISAHFSGAAVTVKMIREELNLDQYRRVRRDDSSSVPPSPPPAGGGNLVLKVAVEEAEDGVPAGELAPGDVVRVFLTDERDVAQYVSKLLGGRSGGEVKALPAPVEETGPDDGQVRLQLRLSGSILGVARVAQGARIKVDRRADESWWRKLLPRRRS